MLPSQLTFTQNQRNPESLKPELYNIWNFAKITNETQHPGNIPKEIIENLLYYYTKPFDVVYDPMAGRRQHTTSFLMLPIVSLAIFIYDRFRID